MSAQILRRAILMALALTALLSHHASASTDPIQLPTVMLDPEVVAASRIQTPLSRTPATVSVISQGQIEKNPALNLSYVLQNDAAITAKQYGGIGQVPEISLRGADTKHTLFLKDGARLNNQNDFNPVYPGFLDLTDASRVEIVKGSSSVQHGSDAIGGVINIVSKKPVKTGGFVTGVYGENDTYKVIAGGDFVAENGFYTQVRGQRLETDGTRIFNDQARSQKASYDQKGYSAKMGYDNRENLDTSIEISRNEGVNIFSEDSGLSNAAAREFENQVINAKVAFKASANTATALRYSRISDEQNVPSHGSHYNTNAHEIDINHKVNFATYQNILIGATANRSRYESSTITDDKQTIYTIGHYAQHQYNTNKLNTQIGVRLEDNERFGSHTVYQAAARYHFTPATSIHANHGTAFRAPSLNELYSQWGGNTELTPEESQSFEVGITQKYGDHTTINLSGYRTEIDHLISNPTWLENINIDGESVFKGGELSAKYVRGDYYASLGYNFVKTENKNTGLEIAYRPKHNGTLTIGYDNGQVGTSISVLARGNSNAQNAANSIKVPGFTTVDVDAYWQINPTVRLFTNIQNIGNVENNLVYNFGNWYINGGRAANIGVTLSY